MIIDEARELKQCTQVASGPEGLAAIHQSGIAATLWERAPLDRFQAWIDALPPEQLPRTRIILRPEAVCNALIEVTRFYGTPECPERNMLIEDASALAAIFADVMDCNYLQLRLDVIQTNACRKFHIDAVTARLICTYRGTGTQYGLSTTGDDPATVLTVPTGSPIVLRGTRWPEDPPSGLLHRSPPIAGTGETRLLLVLDPVEDPEQELGTAYIH
ncbi:DUF1826 domain-containing protein [Rhodovulum sulfidophilum]|uniref:DUF1826 domain-containing protein n=1 Tax=Rhodovulum sulfidophilum TaxID=35806 RepID=UPI0019207CA9|nr:DUF1826 domain-containing protein [Rhodovulum sulfidophilum]MBL3576164.1 DUF1826 domain-containing protein [Rhodovulum sulfidophilum]MCE8433458.1 DUF1826 domain-containing protein [Rhodovulum sulfidophilum]MCF4119356.1 DUF1826 domain-containing protein [Rhodovulum sulfidophilum]